MAAEDRIILERNFDLAWCFSIEQAKRLYNYYRQARMNDPTSLLQPFGYPHLIWIDYNFDSSHTISIAFGRHPDFARRYRETLDPLRGRDVGRWRSPDIENTGSTRLPGLFAGTSIASQFQDFGLPTGANHGATRHRAMRGELSANSRRSMGIRSGPALREGRIDPALAQEIGIIHSIGNAIAIASQTEIDEEQTEPLSGAGSNRPRNRVRNEAATKALLVTDLLNPAPGHLLIARHRKSGKDDVRKILERIPD